MLHPAFPPVLNLEDWRAGGPTAIALAEQAVLIFRREGFCQLINHGVRPGLIAEAFAMMRRLFQLPASTKMQIAKSKSPFFRGFEGLMSELTNGKNDYREQVDTWSDHAESCAELPVYERLKGPSQYFSDLDLPGYKQLTLEMMAELAAVGRELLRILALGLGQPPEFFTAHVRCMCAACALHVRCRHAACTCCPYAACMLPVCSCTHRLYDACILPVPCPYPARILFACCMLAA